MQSTRTKRRAFSDFATRILRLYQTHINADFTLHYYPFRLPIPPQVPGFLCPPFSKQQQPPSSPRPWRSRWSLEGGIGFLCVLARFEGVRMLPLKIASAHARSSGADRASNRTEAGAFGNQFCKFCERPALSAMPKRHEHPAFATKFLFTAE